MTLVGNKCDLMPKNENIDNEISKEAEALADKYHILYYETSAKLNINVSQMFDTSATQFMKFKKQKNNMEQPILKNKTKICFIL